MRKIIESENVFVSRASVCVCVYVKCAAFSEGHLFVHFSLL